MKWIFLFMLIGMVVSASSEGNTPAQNKQCVVQLHDPFGGDSSGILLGPNVILTCAHCVPRHVNAVVGVRFRDGETTLGFVERFSPWLDLAIVQIAGVPKELSYPVIEIDEKPQVGETVYSFGHQYGLRNSLTRGYIMRWQKNYHYNWLESLPSVMQLDGAWGYGSSGSPVFSQKTNRLVGILQRKVANEDIAFAITSQALCDFLINCDEVEEQLELFPEEEDNEADDSHER